MLLSLAFCHSRSLSKRPAGILDDAYSHRYIPGPFISKKWYHLFVSMKGDLRAYKQRWEAVEAVQLEERRNETIYTRWQQLDAAHRLAKELGILEWDKSELEVFEIWAKLKDQENKLPKK